MLDSQSLIVKSNVFRDVAFFWLEQFSDEDALIAAYQGYC